MMLSSESLPLRPMKLALKKPVAQIRLSAKTCSGIENGVVVEHSGAGCVGVDQVVRACACGCTCHACSGLGELSNRPVA